MPILVLNSGSSSIKFSVFASAQGSAEPALLLEGEVSGAGSASAKLAQRPANAPATEASVDATTIDAAIQQVLEAVSAFQVEAVGYRVVHPGAKLSDHTRITPEVLREIEAAAGFAPLHDPEAVTLIRASMQRFPAAQHFACFDTVFHRTMPPEATIYAIPQQYRDQGVRRYGFHGLSCESVVRQLDSAGPLPRRMVIAHLGSGCSVTALVDAKSVDTTMGLTPTGGVVMGTRSGDLDPGVMLYLLREQKEATATAEVEKMLNHDSGMAALTGLPNDMKVVRKAAAEGNEPALLALKVFTRNIRKAIGGFAWLLGGLDAVIFTGGIGEHDAETRAEVLIGLEHLGTKLDSVSNRTRGDGMRTIHASDSKIAVLVIPAQEDLVIALHVQRMSAAS